MISSQFITIPVSDGTEMDAYIAIPSTVNAPCLILIQEAFGVNNHIRNVAHKLCDQGYFVIAPELFHRTGKRVEIPYTDFTQAIPHYSAITPGGLLADLKACYNWILQQTSINQKKMGCIGFCLGGRVAYIANTILPLSAAVSYYGSGIDKMEGSAEKLHGAHAFIWGGLDKHIHPENIAAVEKMMQDSGKDFVNIIFSYAEHGFNCDEKPSYHPLAAKEAWSFSLTFLENKLMS